MSHVRHAFVVSTSGIVLSIAVLAAVPAAAPVPEQTTRAVYVTVVDNDGQPVTGLTPADFRLRENNRDREIASVEPATEPMRIALMVEETLTPAGSVRQGLFELIKVLQGKAEMSLVVVGLSNRTAVPYTMDPNALVQGLNDLPLSQRQQTNHVPEGIGEMSRVFQKDRVARPVMVMVALDSQQVSNEQPQSVLNQLRDSNAQLHVVSIQTSQAASDVSGTAGLMEASGRAQVLGDGPRQSGGRQWPVGALTGVPKAMLSIASDLANQYKITYTLPAGTKPSDRLNVTTNRRGVTLRAPTRIWNGE
jgi:VWFA-related protein